MVKEIILYVGPGMSKLAARIEEEYEQGEGRDEYIPEANWNVHIPGKWHKTCEYLVLFTLDKKLQTKVSELLNVGFYEDCAETYLSLSKATDLLLAGL